MPQTRCARGNVQNGKQRRHFITFKACLKIFCLLCNFLPISSSLRPFGIVSAMIALSKISDLSNFFIVSMVSRSSFTVFVSAVKGRQKRIESGEIRQTVSSLSLISGPNVSMICKRPPLFSVLYVSTCTSRLWHLFKKLPSKIAPR